MEYKERREAFLLRLQAEANLGKARPLAQESRASNEARAAERSQTSVQTMVR